MLPEQDLIPRAMAGDDAARAALVPLYFREVESVVIKFLGPSRPQEIEDTAQDAWLRIFDRIQAFDPRRGVKFSTWIYALVRNYCFDVLKKRRLPLRAMFWRNAEGEDVTFDVEATGAITPDVEAERREFATAYLSAAPALSPRQRMVFELRVLEGLEFQEIASRKRLPLGTAKTIFYRTVEKLKTQLSPFHRAA